MKSLWRPLLAVGLIALTVILFSVYIIHNPQVIRELQHVPPQTSLVVLLLYGVFFLALAVVLHFSLVLLGKTIPTSENFLVSAYSSLANFFGPGQSGPGVRAVYLKKRFAVPIKKFIFASLIYYAFYALISGFLLLVGTGEWWKSGLAVVLVGVVSGLVLKWYARRSRIENIGNGLVVGLIGIGAGTVLQALAQIAIYYVEIHAINPHVGLGQIVSYTGAANFSLFVALTPGAIGIREAFLLFSQGLHHIDSTIIVAANIIDRAVYIVFLGLLFVSVLAVHGRKAFRHFRKV